MTYYRHNDGKKNVLPNADKAYYVGWDELPLTCPKPEMSLWNSHPHVYIPLHETDEASCMYCGSKYILKPVTLGEEVPKFANTQIEREYHIRIDRLRLKQS